VLDQCGQFVRAAVGFATLPLPSYDRVLHTLRRWLDSWADERDGALAHERDRHRVGADAVARDAAGGVVGVVARKLNHLGSNGRKSRDRVLAHES
jgi:hypothetical protein